MWDFFGTYDFFTLWVTAIIVSGFVVTKFPPKVKNAFARTFLGKVWIINLVLLFLACLFLSDFSPFRILG